MNIDRTVNALENLYTSRKQSVILIFISTSDISIIDRDMVKVLVNDNHAKRGKWLSASFMLYVDHENKSVILTNINRRKISPAFMDS